MAYEIKVAQAALKTLNKWKKSNPNLYKKCQKIFHELLDHPRTRTGHPEQLKGEGGDLYSRHITAHDRIIYEIFEDHLIVLVIEVEGHYKDK